MDTPKKLSVFLCHSSADKPVVKELYRRLSALDWIDPWLDSEKLLPGQDWNLEIEKAVEVANVVVVVLSKGSLDKEGYVQRELRMALDIALEKPEGTIFIIPLRLEELELPRRLRVWQYVDYFPRNKRLITYEKLLESLRIRANKLGISQDIESRIGENRPNDITKKKPELKKSPKVDITLPKVITSNAKFPIVGIPFSQNRNFSGRQEILNSIRSEFTDKHLSVPFYTITGMGGIGKTQIAVQYSYQYAEDYDLVWWIRSETDASISADYQALSNALLLPVKTKAEQMVFVNLVKNYLENTERKWLLVFDNVESQEKIEKLLLQKGNGHVLITSQSRDWAEIANDSHLIPFTKEEGREFLNRRIKEKDIENSDKLTNLLGGLPLAMEQACAYMERRGTSIDLYVRLFEAQQQELWAKEAAPKDYHFTLTTTWAMAFTQIQQIQPIAEDLLSIFSFFAPDGIPLSIFRSQAHLLPEDMQNVVTNPLELEDCIAVLYGYSLIERDEDFISIHRLVQDVVRSRLSPNKLKIWLQLAVEITEIAFPYDEYNINTWRVCGQALPHALAAAGYARKYIIALERASDIYQKAGEYLRSKAEYPRAAETTKFAIDIRQEILGTTHQKLAQSLSYLGEIQNEQAQYNDALVNYNSALEIYKAHSISRMQHFARTLNNLGLLLKEQGDFESAKKYYEEALAIKRTVLGDNHPDTAISLSSLGTLFQEQGDFGTARKYHEEALAIVHTVLGDNHPDTAISLNNLGLLLQEQGDFGTARKYYEEALAIKRTVLGDNHPSTAASLGNFGLLLQEQGDFGTARKYYEEALAIKRTVLGDDHPDTAISLSNLGTLFQEQGDFESAKKYHEEALAIVHTVLGDNHPATATGLSNLGTLFQEQGDFGTARKYYEEALVIVHTVHGQNHPNYAGILNNIGSVLVKQSKFVEARSYLEQALSIYEKIHGTKHHSLVNILSNLAYVMLKLRLFPKAREYSSWAAKICREAKDKYAECEKIRQLQKSIPMGVGGRNH